MKEKGEKLRNCETVLDIRQSNSVCTFKNNLKTYLFRKLINNGLICCQSSMFFILKTFVLGPS